MLLQYFSNIKDKLPTRDKLFSSKWTRPFAPYFNKPYYWALTRKNVALAVAVGMFCGLIPGPFQILSAFIVAYFLRTQLSVAAFTTFYTNPLTFMPLYYLAYKIGLIFLPSYQGMNRDLHFSELWDMSFMFIWIKKNLIILMVGVPILGIILSILGYILVMTLWRIHIIKKWKARKNTITSQ